MAATDTMTIGASLAQPTIDAIQQKIAAILPSNVASAITSQFAGGSASSGGSGSMMPGSMGGMSFAVPASGGGSGSAAAGSSLAQPTISAIQAQIAALLPSDLARIIHRTARNRPRPPNTWARDFITKNFIKQPIRIVVNDTKGLALIAHFS